MTQADRPLALRCLNPTCANQCHFRPAGSGRQQQFCSSRCRSKYKRMRDSLRNELERVGESLTAGDQTGDAELVHRIAHIRWLVARYE